MSWEMVDEGWGRKAVEMATLAEPSNVREYVFMHQRLGLDDGDHVLDVACGSGLAIELARMRGATACGLDAAKRLIAVAQHRSPESDIRVGDMHDLPWDDATFDVVTSFRGVWGTTPDALSEIHRVLKPGGRFAMTCWGNVGKSPGAWMMAPFLWATEDKIDNQANMVSLGRPGVGEDFLRSGGFEPGERFRVPFAFEYADPAAYARALASTGPAYEAIQSIGEEEFLRRAEELAQDFVVDGVPLRGELELFGYIGTRG